MTYMRDWMSLKFGQIRLLVPMTIDRGIVEKNVLPLFLGYLYPPQTVFVGGYTAFTLSVHPSVRSSVTFCFLNIFKSL